MNKNGHHLIRLFTAILLFAFLSPVPGATDMGKITLVGTDGVKNSDYGKFLALVFTEAFGRLGYQLQYDGYPAARASAMSDSGKVDGEISRVFEYQAAHPDLIRVEEALYATKFVAFAYRRGIRVHGWESLKNTPYKIEYRRGVKLSESKLSLVVPQKHLSDVSSAELGLKKLISGRTDLYVDVEFTIHEAIKELSPKAFDESRLYQAGIMQQVNAFAYLHKRHAALVPRVAEVLKTMKREGLFEHYMEMAIQPP